MHILVVEIISFQRPDTQRPDKNALEIYFIWKGWLSLWRTYVVQDFTMDAVSLFFAFVAFLFYLLTKSGKFLLVDSLFLFLNQYVVESVETPFKAKLRYWPRIWHVYINMYVQMRLFGSLLVLISPVPP